MMFCPRCAREIPDDAILCCYCARTIVKKPPARTHQRGNGTGTAYKRGKTWTAYVVTGWKIGENDQLQHIAKTKGGFKTKAEALAYCAVLKSETEEVKKRVPLLREYWHLYERGEMSKLSHDKQVAYGIAWKKLTSIENKPVSSLTVSDLRSAVSSSATTYYPARDMKIVLSHLFKLAAADGYVSKDLPSFIILPDLKEKTREPFTSDEQASIWRAYESGVDDAAIPLIMIYTGMMTGEMRRLTVQMIDLESRRITGVGLKTEVRKAAPVYIPDVILPVLQSAMEGKTDRLYPISEDDFYTRYYAALDAAGTRRLTPYSCRHTTATALAITENIAPETVRKVMRWSTTAMLSRYAHPDDKDALNAVNTLKRQDG